MPSRRARQSRVLDLMQEADVDEVEALVTLWDAGVASVRSASDLVPASLMARARESLGLTSSRRDQFTVEYWVGKSGLSRDEFAERVATAGVRIAPGARRIPKNSYRKLRQLFEPVLPTEPSLPEGRFETPAKKPPPLVWEPFGVPGVRKYLSEQDIEAIHTALVDDFREADDPIEPPGVRSRNLLSSAAFAPHTSLGNTQKYPTVEFAAAALFHRVILDHAFFNGNKRTAVVALVVFLNENNLVLTCTEDELFRISLRTAQHALVPLSADELADREVFDLATWIRSNSRQVDHSERPMKWLKLKQRLRELGCQWAPASGKGNRLNIFREVEIPKRGLIRERIEKELLQTQVAYAGDGTEADREVVHKIRRDLRLDDLHGCDSNTFYDSAIVDEFITKYRRLLRQLGRF